MPQIGKETLLVISHVQLYFWEDQLWAFGPYVREIDIWAELFPSVIICSPLKKAEPTGDCLSFSRTNISLSPVNLRGGGSGLKNKIQMVLSLPSVIRTLANEMKNAWAIHVRLPGNLGALGAAMAPLFSKRVIAKYAGTWPDFSGEPLSYRLQKKLLLSMWFKGPVTVYGSWPNQPSHIIPFFTSILSADQMHIAKNASANRQIHNPVRILFVGRFDRGKNAHVLLDALSILKNSSLEFEARIIGDGTEKENLHRQCNELDLGQQVEFLGAIPFSQVLENYLWGDSLVLTSENAEGWPKAIAEGMAFGLACFGSQRGLIPQMLADGRGIVVDPVTPENLAIGIMKVIKSPEAYKEISEKAAAWSQEYTLERLKMALKQLMEQSWSENGGAVLGDNL